MRLTRESCRSVLPHLLLMCGTAFAYVGAREFLDSYFGQSAAADSFAAAPAVSTISIPSPAPPLRLGDTMAKLSIPRLSAQLYVIQGAGARELRRGPGHLAETALPGARGNCVIAGHRDTHFRILKDIRPGDEITVDTGRGEYTYRVQSTSVVSPKDTRSLRPTSTPVLTLVTCYPFYYVGASPKRFVVIAGLSGESAQNK